MPIWYPHDAHMSITAGLLRPSTAQYYNVQNKALKFIGLHYSGHKQHTCPTSMSHKNNPYA